MTIHHPHHNPSYTRINNRLQKALDSFTKVEFPVTQDVFYSTPHSPHFSMGFLSCPRCQELEVKIGYNKNQNYEKNEV